MPSAINPWRRTFIALAEDLCRLQDVPAPSLFGEFDKALIVSVDVNGIVTDVIHPDPDDAAGCLLIQCRVAGAECGLHCDATQKALILNQYPAHQMGGRHALDDETGELVYRLQMHLAHVTASELMDVIDAMTANALTWQNEHSGSLLPL